MKNMILKYFPLCVMFLMVMNLKSQIIVDMSGGNANLPSDYMSTGSYYIKDVHNYLDYFAGTWQYTYNNEKFELIFTKKTKFHTILPNIGINVYEDGIAVQYKKYENNSLVYSSPIENYPSLSEKSNIVLKGMITDYGRLTKESGIPQLGLTLNDGGKPLTPTCVITKVYSTSGSPQIKFSLACVFCGSYDNDTYSGQPYFSVPNNIILTKQ